jgi:hypothetical protein
LTALVKSGTSFGPDLPRRAARTIVLTAGILALASWGPLGRDAALALFLGAAWGALNLLAWERLVRSALGAGGLSLSRALVPLLVKLPGVYALGAALLLLRLPTVWLAAGFTWSLAVPVLKVAGSAAFGSSRRSARGLRAGLPAREGITG